MRRYLSSCPVNYARVNCQFPLKCKLCKNGTVCSKYVDGAYSCSFYPGFTGSNCDIIINADRIFSLFNV
jgi:hypothetical protein